MKISLTFLGTGASTGVPVVGSTSIVSKSKNAKDKRLRASVKISWENNIYIIDCGPDFRQQMIRENINRIDGILLTHEHNDHIGGLDDIRGYYFKQGKIPFYLYNRVLKELEKRFDYIFKKENRYPSAPEVQINLISHENNFKLGNLNVIPIEVMHGKLPILGYRFEKIAYLTDIKSIRDVEKEKLKGIEILIVTGLRKEIHNTHFNIDEALDLINQVKPKKAYLTHISELLGLHDEVEAELPENVFLAYDGLCITTD